MNHLGSPRDQLVTLQEKSRGKISLMGIAELKSPYSCSHEHGTKGLEWPIGQDCSSRRVMAGGFMSSHSRGGGGGGGEEAGLSGDFGGVESLLLLQKDKKRKIRVLGK